MRSLTSSRALSFALLAGLGLAVTFASAPGCGSGDGDSTFPPDGGAPGNGLDGSFTNDAPNLLDASSGPFDDFPTPIVDAPDGGVAAPPNAGDVFGAAGAGASSGGPCLVEPEVGTLYPKNWLRPRFRWNAANGENLFELRVHADNQLHDLVVYTASTTWTMPQAAWDALRSHSADVPMTVTVRGGVFDGSALTGVAVGSSGALGIAPVEAPGSIVYWTTTGGSSLKGFKVGDETVGTVLVPSDVQERSTSCIGCHTSTPDGKFVGLTLDSPWSNAIASIEKGIAGSMPSFLGAGGKAALAQAQLGISTFSRAHWSDGDHVEVVGNNPADDGNAQLLWIDLEAADPAKASGVIARNGDPAHAAAPAWSHDGKTIAYVSTNAIRDGRLDKGDADIYSVPYNDRKGADGDAGAGPLAKPVPGASDPSFEEYYPVFSPDDAFLAFSRVPNGTNMYNADPAEVYVVPSAGGTAVRLKANDPPACTQVTSPGIINSWPKWAPSVAAAGGRTFYWIVFSSIRLTKSEPKPHPQLFVTPVVVENGQIQTYAALYLWNQPVDESNHTPAWDEFKIPPPPPPR